MLQSSACVDILQHLITLRKRAFRTTLCLKYERKRQLHAHASPVRHYRPVKTPHCCLVLTASLTALVACDESCFVNPVFVQQKIE